MPVDPLSGGDHGRRRCPPKVPGQRISSALYSELSASAGAKPKGVSLGAHRGDCLAVGQSLPVANRPVLHPTVASGAPGQRDQPRCVYAARRPFSGRPGPGRCTLAGRWSASRRSSASTRQSRKPHRPTRRRCVHRRGYLPLAGECRQPTAHSA